MSKENQLYFEVYEGITLVIPFTVSSFPVLPLDIKHTITYFNGPQEVPATTRFEVKDNVITLNNIQLSDSGMYQIHCRGTNGQTGKENFELQVWSKFNCYSISNSIFRASLLVTQCSHNKYM